MKFRNYKRYMVIDSTWDDTNPAYFKTKQEALAFLKNHKTTYGAKYWIIVELIPRRIIK